MRLIGFSLSCFLPVAQLPAAAKGSIDVDQVESNFARGNGQLVLLLDLRGFQIKNSVEIDDAGAVLLHPKLGGRRGRLDAALQGPRPVP